MICGCSEFFAIVAMLEDQVGFPEFGVDGTQNCVGIGIEHLDSFAFPALTAKAYSLYLFR